MEGENPVNKRSALVNTLYTHFNMKSNSNNIYSLQHIIDGAPKSQWRDSKKTLLEPKINNNNYLKFEV